MDYDENVENEIIKATDFSQVLLLHEDKDKYKALHSHINYFNRKARSYSPNSEKNVFNHVLLNSVNELNIFNEPQPCVAGFKHELDRVEKVGLIKKYMSTPNYKTNFVILFLFTILIRLEQKIDIIYGKSLG